MIAAVLASLVLVTAPAPKLVWSLPAGSAVLAADTVVLWAPDFRSVLGVDVHGKRRWRVATGDQGGVRALDHLGGNVLAYAGEEALLIAPDSGKVLGRQPHVALATPGGVGCRVESHAGACAVVCACGFLPIRCEDLGAAAPRASIPTFEEWDTAGHRTSTCMGRAGRLVGRGGDVIVVEVPAATAAAGVAIGGAKAFGLETDLVGFDAHTAQERWRSHALVDGLGDFDVELSGALPDGRTCWLGSRSGALRVFDCQRATLTWKRQSSVPAGSEAQVEVAGDGLVVRDGGQAVALSAGGAVRWQAAVPKNELFVMAGDHAARARRFARLAGATVLDPVSGAVRAHLPFVAGTTRWPVPLAASEASDGGWLALGDDQYTLVDAAGQATTAPKSAAFIEDLTVGATLVALRTRGGVTVRGRADASTVAVDGDVVVALEGLVGVGRVLVLKDGSGPWDPKDPATFGELRLYDVGEP